MTEQPERQPTAWDNPPDTPIQMVVTGRWTQSPGALDRLKPTLQQLWQIITDYVEQRSQSAPPGGLLAVTALANSIADLQSVLAAQVTFNRLVSLAGAKIGLAVGEGILPQYLDALSAEAQKLHDFITKERQNPNLDLLPTIAAFDLYLAGWQRQYLNPVLDEILSMTADEERYRVEVSNAFERVLFQRQTQRIQELAQQAEKTVDDIKDAGYDAGSGRIARSFADAAESEHNRSRFWTRSVFICLGLGVALSFAAVSIETDFFSKMPGIGGIIARALIGTPFYVAAAYCARIAAHHRQADRYFTILTAQINTVGAYVTKLPEDEQHELIMMLGKHAFSSPELKNVDKGKLTVVPKDVRPIIDKGLYAANRGKRPRSGVGV
jgi:hypothetical protein